MSTYFETFTWAICGHIYVDFWAGLGLGLGLAVRFSFYKMFLSTNPICSVIFTRVVKLRYQMMSIRSAWASIRIKEPVYNTKRKRVPVIQLLQRVLKTFCKLNAIVLWRHNWGKHFATKKTFYLKKLRVLPALNLTITNWRLPTWSHLGF